MAATDALQAMLNAHAPFLSQVCEGGFIAPKWWEACREYTKLARTDVVCDDAAFRYLREDWKHRLGWERNVLPGVKSLQFYGLLDDFKILGEHSSGQWDGTSFLYGSDTKEVLFRTDKRSLDKNCPQETPLFCKFLRRILHQCRTDNPLAPPEMLRHLSTAIISLKIGFDEVNTILDVCERSVGGDIAKIREARKRLKELRKCIDLSRQGKTIEAVLTMPFQERTAYYRSIRQSDRDGLKRQPDPRQLGMFAHQ